VVSFRAIFLFDTTPFSLYKRYNTRFKNHAYQLKVVKYRTENLTECVKQYEIVVSIY